MADPENKHSSTPLFPTRVNGYHKSLFINSLECRVENFFKFVNNDLSTKFLILYFKWGKVGKVTYFRLHNPKKIVFRCLIY
jgi:hypothetical protein